VDPIKTSSGSERLGALRRRIRPKLSKADLVTLAHHRLSECANLPLPPEHVVCLDTVDWHATLLSPIHADQGFGKARMELDSGLLPLRKVLDRYGIRGDLREERTEMGRRVVGIPEMRRVDPADYNDLGLRLASGWEGQQDEKNGHARKRSPHPFTSHWFISFRRGHPLPNAITEPRRTMPTRRRLQLMLGRKTVRGQILVAKCTPLEKAYFVWRIAEHRHIQVFQHFVPLQKRPRLRADRM